MSIARAVAVLVALTWGAVAASAQEDFYKGKTLDIVVGSTPGGAYDGMARVVGHYIARYIPGTPSIIIKNMPGAGGIVVTSWLYNIAPKDGLTMAAPAPQALLEPLLGDTEVAKYDALKFETIGSAASLVYLCVVRFDAPIKTLLEAKTTEVTMGASTVASIGPIMVKVFHEVLGTKFKTITGYKGSADTALAVERGEVQGSCGGTDQINPARAFAASGKLNILVQYGLEGLPRLNAKNVPMIWEFVQRPEDRALLEFMMAPQAFGRPFFMPPGVPADRVAIIRRAFDRTMADPEFLAECQKLELEATLPVTGERMKEILQKTYAASQATIERAKAVLH